jgi:hypothetical protein
MSGRRPAIAPARASMGVVVVCCAAVSLAGGACISLFPAPFATENSAPPVEGSAAAQADFLPIARLRWARGSETAVLLSPDGTLQDHGAVVGTLRRDGSFTTRSGQQALTMRPDGWIHVGAGFDVQIAEDGTATTKVHGQPDETVTLEQVQKARGGRPGLSVEGLAPALRRTSMWILMIPDLLRILASGE